jgi:hypothetical protein
MSLLDEIEIESINATDLDTKINESKSVPPGKYHAALDSAKKVTNKTSGDEGYELTFAILHGPQKGKTSKMWLYKSSEKDAKDRLIVISYRLGLLNKVGDKFARVEGKHDFTDALGTQCVIELVPSKKKADDGKYIEDKTQGQIAYAGVYKLDDDRVKDVNKDKNAVTNTKSKADENLDDL